MNKKWKIVIGITVFVISVAIIWQHLEIKRLTTENQIKDVQIMHANDTVKAYKTKSGEAYFKLKSVEVSNDALKESISEMGVEVSSLKSKEVSYKKIISILQGQIETMGHTGPILLIPTPKDSTIKNFDWTNRFLTFSGILNKSRIQDINYLYKVGITSITEQVGKKSIVTVSLTDPNARIITGSQIVVVPKVKWWDKWWFYTLAGMAGGVYLAK